MWIKPHYNARPTTPPSFLKASSLKDPTMFVSLKHIAMRNPIMCHKMVSKKYQSAKFEKYTVPPSWLDYSSRIVRLRLTST